MHITTSLLHRLLDNNPELRQESGNGHITNYDSMQQEIRSNLEQILNTRLNFFNLSNAYPAVKKSVLNYGMPDFSRKYYGAGNQQIELCQNIKDIIEAYEPRLQNVKIHAVETDSKERRSLVIRIEGVISMRLDNKHAIFESNLDILSYQFSVEEGEEHHE